MAGKRGRKRRMRKAKKLLTAAGSVALGTGAALGSVHVLDKHIGGPQAAYRETFAKAAGPVVAMTPGATSLGLKSAAEKIGPTTLIGATLMNSAASKFFKNLNDIDAIQNALGQDYLSKFNAQDIQLGAMAQTLQQQQMAAETLIEQQAATEAAAQQAIHETQAVVNATKAAIAGQENELAIAMQSANQGPEIVDATEHPVFGTLVMLENGGVYGTFNGQPVPYPHMEQMMREHNLLVDVPLPHGINAGLKMMKHPQTGAVIGDLSFGADGKIYLQGHAEEGTGQVILTDPSGNIPAIATGMSGGSLGRRTKKIRFGCKHKYKR